MDLRLASHDPRNRLPVWNCVVEAGKVRELRWRNATSSQGIRVIVVKPPLIDHERPVLLFEMFRRSRRSSDRINLGRAGVSRIYLD